MVRPPSRVKQLYLLLRYESRKVNEDEAVLQPFQNKELFTGAGFQEALPPGTGMNVIRHISMPEGLFKPFWRADTRGTGRYVDFGSGKAALVNVDAMGKQIASVPLPENMNPKRADEILRELRDAEKAKKM